MGYLLVENIDSTTIEQNASAQGIHNRQWVRQAAHEKAEQPFKSLGPDNKLEIAIGSQIRSFARKWI